MFDLGSVLNLGYNIVSDVLKERRRKKERELEQTANLEYGLEELDRSTSKAVDTARFITGSSGLKELNISSTALAAREAEIPRIKAMYPYANTKSNSIDGGRKGGLLSRFLSVFD